MILINDFLKVEFLNYRFYENIIFLLLYNKLLEPKCESRYQSISILLFLQISWNKEIWSANKWRTYLSIIGDDRITFRNPLVRIRMWYVCVCVFVHVFMHMEVRWGERFTFANSGQWLIASHHAIVLIT